MPRDPVQSFDDDPVLWQFSPESRKSGVFQSLDKRYFFVLSWRGDLQEDRNLTTLQIYSTRPGRLSQGRRPLAEASFYSDSGLAGIRSAVWDVDGRGVLFLGSTPEGFQVHRLDIASAKVQQLTHAKGNVVGFSGRADTVLYIVGWPIIGAPATGLRYPVTGLERFPDGRVYAPSSELQVRQESYIAVGSQGRPYPIAPVGRVSFSPEGKMMVISRFVAGRSELALLKLDAEKPPEEILSVPADSTPAGSAFWSADGRTVVLVGVHPQQTGVQGAATHSFAAYDVREGTWQWFEPTRPGESLASIDWSEGEGRLRAAWKTGRRAAYELHDGNWVALRDSASLSIAPAEVPQVEIRQGENDPPAVVMTEGARQVVFTEEDPALRDVYRIPVRRFRWKHFDGQELEGGLLLPRDYRPGRPVPVVIQPYFYLPKLFLPDGVNRTGDAAQALAARGMAVLLISTPDLVLTPPGQRGVPMEGAEFVHGIDSIVDSLVEQGITQPDQVALLGFSRGGYLTRYAMTHPGRTHLATAVVNDAFLGSQLLYIYWQTFFSLDQAPSYGAVGRRPWEDPQFWWQEDPLLNADRVQAPILFSATTVSEKNPEPGDDATSKLEMGAYRANRKAVDYLFVMRANHELQNPLQKVALMEATVDWMSFWLQGQENPDPSKAMQNRRWRRLRTEWAAEQAKDITRGEPGFIKTRSGLMYSIRRRVVGQEPRPGDTLQIHYVAKASDGAELINTRAGGTPVVVKLKNEPVPDARLTLNENGTPGVQVDGWDEGLRFVHAGEKATFLMRRELAPSSEAARQKASEGSVIRYDVEVLSIEKGAQPSTQTKPPASLRRKADGGEAVGVQLSPGQGLLGDMLKREIAQAGKLKRTAFVLLVSADCAACDAVNNFLSNPPREDEGTFSKVYLIKLDTVAWRNHLRPRGFDSRTPPRFYRVNEIGEPVGPDLVGATWAASTPAQISARLKDFFQSTTHSTASKQ